MSLDILLPMLPVYTALGGPKSLPRARGRCPGAHTGADEVSCHPEEAKPTKDLTPVAAFDFAGIPTQGFAPSPRLQRPSPCRGLTAAPGTCYAARERKEKCAGSKPLVCIGIGGGEHEA
jgi:hypothetical protein